MSDASHNGARAPTSLDALVKKMVRFALASEYARIPIRRADISTKVLGEQGTGMFKTVFEQAQRHLREKFGMEMTELPPRDKQTTQERRGEFSFPFLTWREEDRPEIYPHSKMKYETNRITSRSKDRKTI